MTTLREWKEKRPNYALLETLIFSHISFDSDYNCIKNQFQDITINSIVFSPASFSVVATAQDGTAANNLTVTFDTGAEDVRKIMKDWQGKTRMSPISAKYQIWNSANDSEALLTISLYVKDLTYDASDVTVTLSLTNPLTLGSEKIYRTKDYPGLKTS